MINVGVIGCGVIGKRRIENFPKNFKLIACADPKIFEDKYLISKKIFLTKDWKKLINLRDLDAVIIATTHNLQSTLISESLKKNLNIFVEKPGGISAIETKKIIKRNKKKIVIKVGYNHRYHPAFLKAKKMIKENQIGKLMYIRAIYGHGGRLNYNKEWRFNKKLSGGGELIDKGSHLIDLSRIFLGDLKVDKFKLGTFFWKMKEEDNCFMILKNRKNKLAFLHASCTEWKNKFIFEIFGKKGKLEINGLGKSYGKETLTFYKMSKKMGPPKIKKYLFKNIDYSWKKEMLDFSKDILKKKNSSPNLIDVYKNLKIINQMYQKK